MSRRPATPTASMVAALRRALWLERFSPQGEPWVTHRNWVVVAACVRRGLAATYQVTPGGQVFYRITEAGRRAAERHGAGLALQTHAGAPSRVFTTPSR